MHIIVNIVVHPSIITFIIKAYLSHWVQSYREIAMAEFWLKDFD